MLGAQTMSSTYHFYLYDLYAQLDSLLKQAWNAQHRIESVKNPYKKRNMTPVQSYKTSDIETDSESVAQK